MNKNLENIDLVVLCGGLGTRISPVLKNKPKVLAPIGKQAFLDILLQRLIKAGFKNFVLSVGYLKEQVKQHIKKNYESQPINIRFSEEENPLGTGGALKLALSKVVSDNFFVINGDTICGVDFKKFYAWHLKSGASVSLALAKSDRSDGGRVAVDQKGWVTSFLEKQKADTEGYISGGVYIMDKSVRANIPSRSVFSLENDLFPRLVKERKCFGFPIKGKVVDIGTPERYKSAVKEFSV